MPGTGSLQSMGQGPGRTCTLAMPGHRAVVAFLSSVGTVGVGRGFTEGQVAASCQRPPL